MVTKVRETEWKYDVPAGVTLPDLSALPEVAELSPPERQVLRAVYHDTADLRLVRAGITLRRRTGGGDAGWHLKLPDQAGSRIELRLPAGRDLPAELAGLVRAWTRGRPLEPVARITTTRRKRLLRGPGGSTLAEVVVDGVTAESLGAHAAPRRWDEVEVELVDGDLRLLKAADKLLQRSGMVRSARTAKLEFALAGRLAEASPGSADGSAAGGPGKAPSAAEAVLGYLAAQVDALVAWDPKVRQAEPDAVHTMRVTTRRIRSALRSFEPLFAPDSTIWLFEELTWLADVLGQARDEEVLGDHLLANLAALAESSDYLVLGPVRERIDARFEPSRDSTHASVLEALDGERYLALLAGLDALLAEPPLAKAAERRAAKELPPLIDTTFRRVDKRMARAFETPPGGAERDVALHEARKAAKRARYAAEAVSPALGKRLRRSAKAMKGLQTVLGEHQDSVLAAHVIRELGLAAHAAGENAFTYGVLYERDAAALPVLQAEAERAWKQARRTGAGTGAKR
ncbi:MAG TPA: CYTH and CHAD domain-containing protein [Actinocrinis sp.]|nr:CYTH and CHAD domain-containing protein [Actinocrinis sp.]